MNTTTPHAHTQRNAPTPPDQVRVLQIIYAALGGGVVLLAVILLGVVQGGSAASPRVAGLLSLVHAGTALGAFTMGMLLFQVQLRRVNASDKPMATITSAYVARSALFEGPSIFGIIVLFLTGQELLAEQPVYWANLASSVIFLLMLAATFPTEDRIRDLLRRNARPGA